MRTLDVSVVTDAVAELCVRTNTSIGEDHERALRDAREREESELGREVLDQLLDNARAVAGRDGLGGRGRRRPP